MNSSWEETKQRSKYHFNTNLNDPKYDTVIKLGRILPNWQDLLPSLIEESKSVTWRTRGNPKKKSRPESELSSEDYDLERTGYGKEYVISNLNYNVPRELERISEAFALNDCMTRIHVQHPGQIWNLHLDKLEKWDRENPEFVMRIMIQLTDWQQGHFWSYGNYTFTRWKAGDVTTFDWMNVPHCTANAGHTPRVTLQLTGIKTEETDKFLIKLRNHQEILL
jgi:hypothetical protein